MFNQTLSFATLKRRSIHRERKKNNKCLLFLIFNQSQINSVKINECSDRDLIHN